MTKRPIGTLVSSVAEKIACGDSDEALVRLSRDTPDFLGSEYLDPIVAKAWPRLSVDARLIACLWASAASDEANAQIERNECADGW